MQHFSVQGSNTTCLISCGFVVQHIVQQNHNKSKAVQQSTPPQIEQVEFELFKCTQSVIHTISITTFSVTITTIVWHTQLNMTTFTSYSSTCFHCNHITFLHNPFLQLSQTQTWLMPCHPSPAALSITAISSIIHCKISNIPRNLASTLHLSEYNVTAITNYHQCTIVCITSIKHTAIHSTIWQQSLQAFTEYLYNLYLQMSVVKASALWCSTLYWVIAVLESIDSGHLNDVDRQLVPRTHHTTDWRIYVKLPSVCIL